jgi:outer membrane receptor protein involved in Fe transport
MKTRKRTLLVPLLIAASAPLISAAATGDQPASKPEDRAAAKPDDKAKDDSQLQTVTITAEHSTTSLQRTADSVSVRNGADMEAKGRFTLAQILEDVAGVTGGAAGSANGAVASSGTDAPAAGLTIRGIVSNSGAGGSVTTVAPAAAIYVDGVYSGIGGGYDLDRVEVLRGPQGTLYGRSATSGLVAIHTADPELGEFEANALAELGSYDLRHYTAAINVPLGEHLAMRFAANHIERNGYFDKQGGEFSTNDARLKFLYKPNADVSLLAGYSLENNITHNGGTTIGLNADQSYNYSPIPIGSGKNNFRQYWAQLDVNLGLATLTWLPAIRTWESAGTGYINAAGQFTLRQTIAAPLDRFNTQEVRLASAKGSKIEWQLGALYYKNTVSNANEVYLLPPIDMQAFNSVTKKKVTDADGAYGQVTYPFSDATRMTAGARYDTTKVAVDQDYTSISGQTQSLSGPDGERKFRNTTWKLRAEHDLDASKMLYASVSTGFSPGDITVTTNSAGNPVVLTLNAETLTAWEIGTKNRFLDNRLQVNGALFYYDYTGYQTANVNITPELTTPGYATLSTPANMWGGELEVQWKLTPSDMLSADVSYTNARYRERNSTLISTGTGTDVTFGDFFAKDQIPGVVPVRINASYTHGFHFANGSSLSATGSARYMSGYDGAPLTKAQAASAERSADARVNSQVVADFNLNWQSPAGMYSVGGYVRNITDNRYKTFVTVNDTGANATPYDPRTFGVIMRVSY